MDAIFAMSDIGKFQGQKARSMDTHHGRYAEQAVREHRTEIKRESPAKRRKSKHRVEIYIDAKEPGLPGMVSALYEDITESNFVLGKALPTGDIRIDVDGIPSLMIERKTTSDFAGSLGRGNHFREQRARMLDDKKQYPNLVLMVAMEGRWEDVNWANRKRITREYCEQICRELPPKYDIHVAWFANQLELLHYIGQVDEMYEKYGSPQEVITGSNYLESFYVGRKRALQSGEFAAMALTQIEGVSHDVACCIMGVHKSLPCLLADYARVLGEDDAETQLRRETMLENVRHGSSNRRIGKKLSARIYHTLHSEHKM